MCTTRADAVPEHNLIQVRENNCFLYCYDTNIVLKSGHHSIYFHFIPFLFFFSFITLHLICMYSILSSYFLFFLLFSILYAMPDHHFSLLKFTYFTINCFTSTINCTNESDNKLLYTIIQLYNYRCKGASRIMARIDEYFYS